MFFSRVTVPESARNSSEFWDAFRTAYTLHQAVWQLFGDHPDRRRDFLYHLKESSGPPVVYAVSTRRPRAADALWQVETSEFAPKLHTGMQLGFLLRANPVRTRDGKRHDVVMEEKHRLQAKGSPRSTWPLEAELVQAAAREWLGRRAEGLGFRVQGVRADGYRQHEFAKPGDKRPVRISTVDLTGVLEVVDPVRFFQGALCGGVGPAKSFGCGLMLVRRA